VVPASKNFPSTDAGSSSSQVFTVFNAGSADLHVTSVSLTGGNTSQFTITDDGGGAFTLGAEDDETITIQFNPTDFGYKTAALTIASDDPDEAILNVPLSGTGRAPDISVDPPSPCGFGDWSVGASLPQVFTISNNGNTDLNVSSVTLSGTNMDEFAITDDAGGSFSVVSGASEDVTVAFNPASEGTKAAILCIVSNDPNETTVNINMTGNALPPSKVEDTEIIPAEFSLLPNYPNPFNSQTVIPYQVPRTSDVTIKVYNASGQHIRTLVSEMKSPGSYEVHWAGRDAANRSVSGGLYIITMKTLTYFSRQKVVLLK